MKDPYVYDDCDVLINQANIKDKDKLAEFENRMTNLAIVSLFKNVHTISDTKDVFKIHKQLFEHVYEWAGIARTINIYKDEPILGGISVEYTAYNHITKALKQIDHKYFKQDWKSLRIEDFIHLFTRMIADIWQVHPFREGNTRVVSAFAFLFLKQQGYNYNVALIRQHAKYFRNALVMASLGEHAEYQYLQNILVDAITNEDAAVSKDKYTKIKDYEINTYQYVHHKAK